MSAWPGRALSVPTVEHTDRLEQLPRAEVLTLTEYGSVATDKRYLSTSRQDHVPHQPRYLTISLAENLLVLTHLPPAHTP